MSSRRGLIPVVALLATPITLPGQGPAAVQQAIARIEHRLLPPVIINGRPVETKTLAGRMRELRVPGVSVAVFPKGLFGV